MSERRKKREKSGMIMDQMVEDNGTGMKWLVMAIIITATSKRDYKSDPGTVKNSRMSSGRGGTFNLQPAITRHLLYHLTLIYFLPVSPKELMLVQRYYTSATFETQNYAQALMEARRVSVSVDLNHWLEDTPRAFVQEHHEQSKSIRHSLEASVVQQSHRPKRIRPRCNFLNSAAVVADSVSVAILISHTRRYWCGEHTILLGLVALVDWYSRYDINYQLVCAAEDRDCS
ncbi:hypothetical protein CBL_07979 [Carabus blaptoides fortunei]